jgi:hypothetical protein
MGTNIFTLARQQWSQTISHGVQHDLIQTVSRERSLFAAIVAAGSVVFIHTHAFAPFIYDSGDPVTGSNPPPGSAMYLRNISHAIFEALRDSVNYHTTQGVSADSNGDPMHGQHFPQLSPFFACTQRIAAIGCFLAISRSPTLQATDLARAALATDFQLAERTIRKQCSKWSNSDYVIEDIQTLRRKMQVGISSSNLKIIACGDSC